MDIKFIFTKTILIIHVVCFILLSNVFSQRAVQNAQQSESIISSSSYGLYFRGYNGAEITLDNNGKPTIGGKDLESIPGKLYWNSEYTFAKIFLKGNKYLGEYKVRFEQLNQIFFVLSENDTKTSVVDPLLVERVVFSGIVQDWANPVFTNNIGNNTSKFENSKHTYFQELVIGAVSIYKSCKSVIRFQDSLFGTIKKPYIIPQQSYYIFYGNEFSELKKITYKNLSKAIPILEKEFKDLAEMPKDINNEKQLIHVVQELNIQLNKKGKK